MKKAAQRFLELFDGSETLYGTHGTPELDDNGVKWGIKRTARTLRGEVTLKMWSDHLGGTTPLGIIPIKNDSTCCWGSADIDDYEVDAVALVQKVESLKLPLVPCRSKSGGLHLFLFSTVPVAAELMQGILREISARLGHSGCEIFPKQTKILVEQGDQGNWMVMPYFGGDYGGKLRMQYGLKKTGAEMTPDEFLTFAEKRRQTPEQLDALREQLLRGAEGKPNGAGRSRKASANGAGKKNHESHPFHNGPPCLQHMSEGGFPDGGRNNALFHIGVFLRRAHPDEWQILLRRDNERFMRPPLPEEEVLSVIRSLEKREYEYTCNNQPMASHCNSVTCRSRKYGVGAGGAYPVVESLSKLVTEPPLWFVQIPGARVVMEHEELTNYRKFHNACIGAANVCFKLISDKEWVSILGDAMKSMQESDFIAAPLEVGRTGVFIELVCNFLTNRTIGEKKEDLLRNVPWENEEKKEFVFTIKALEDYVKRENIQPRFTRRELCEKIKTVMRGGHFMMDIKNQRNVRLWSVPSSEVNRAPELDPPREEREVI